MSVFNVGAQPCTLEGFARVLLYAGRRRIPAGQRSVAGDITADTQVALVTLAPEPRASQRHRSSRNAFFLIELGNDCAVSRVMAQLEPRAQLREILRGRGVCVLPNKRPLLTVSQYQPDPVSS